jgi:hypothetical protein
LETLVWDSATTAKGSGFRLVNVYRLEDHTQTSLLGKEVLLKFRSPALESSCLEFCAPLFGNAQQTDTLYVIFEITAALKVSNSCSVQPWSVKPATAEAEFTPGVIRHRASSLLAQFLIIIRWFLRARE